MYVDGCIGVLRVCGGVSWQVLRLCSQRKSLQEYLSNKFEFVSPNLKAVVGEVLAARLISHAGALVNLAKYPASTIQILGAEKVTQLLSPHLYLPTSLPLFLALSSHLPLFLAVSICLSVSLCVSVCLLVYRIRCVWRVRVCCGCVPVCAVSAHGLLPPSRTAQRAEAASGVEGSEGTGKQLAVAAVSGRRRLRCWPGSVVSLDGFQEVSLVLSFFVCKALFRALKSKSGRTPKYGILFHSSFIGRVQKQQHRGRMSR